ncbi:3-oxoacyl-[acyl-carrier-protein] synthase III C-terminal domain-containing protein [Micromonospora sp. NPDC023956]|uniref:3-oxoacyl-[acyl-carrier-protein] synthase III C-terminal domain-containing protein n=1 Tax=Micromonospora sp. NPDC023956 TaxID=3155722 RepID=UPI003408B12D
MPAVGVGVAGLGVALGEPCSVAETAASYVEDPERVLNWGYHTYHRSPPGQSPTRLAARAATAALADAGVDPSAVDLLVVANSEVPEFLQWDVSAAVAREVGTTAPTLLLNQGCASAVTGFQQVAGHFAVRDDVETVLLVAVNQVSEAHSNRMRLNTCLGSDGASAALLRRGHPRLRWLATEQITDPAYVDFFRVEYGGSAVPLPPDGVGNPDVDVLGLVYRHFRRAPAQLAEFATALTGRVVEVVERACRRVGIDRSEVARLVYLNDNQASIAAVAAAVGVPPERTNASLAAATGHCGAADHLICLDAFARHGDLADGDVIALAGVSSGMHWFCTLLVV